MAKRLEDLTRNEFIKLMRSLLDFEGPNELCGEYFDDTEDDDGFEVFNNNADACSEDFQLWLRALD